MSSKKILGKALTTAGLAAALTAMTPVGAQMGHMTSGTGAAAPGTVPASGMPYYGWGRWGMPGAGMMGMGMMGMMGMGGMGSFGPGMMGPGMMMGPAMMGWGALPAMGPGALNLTADQRKKITAIDEGLRKRQWTLMGKMMEQAAQLHQLYQAEKRDPKKIGAAYGKLFDLKRQMIEAAVEAANRKEAVLTKEQRQRLRQWGGAMGMMW